MLSRTACRPAAWTGAVIALSPLARAAGLALFLFLALPRPGAAEPISLYDGSLGSLPVEQGWIYAALPLGGAQASQRMQDGAVLLDSMPSKGDQAGWFRSLEPAPGLDPVTAFELDFSLRLEAEDHAGSDKDGDGREDRAGLSVIVLTRDLAGIELGFWRDRIWAQEGGLEEPPRFTQAEGSPIELGDELRPFRLRFDAARYALFVDGASEALLQGPLRDYSAEGFPYTTPGFLFLGDNSSSAAARFALARVTLELGSDRPEPTDPPIATATTLAATAEPSPTSDSPLIPAYLPLLQQRRPAQPSPAALGERLRLLLRQILR